ncbi:SDR family oxidoreductase [Amycolatopsis sp. NPDC051373]|uniref:SDR family NAD(P)-dependent oxidoreductase n=1 Tax=Amycolatopsis sp. NPDC051373 TaxID=3155801 RepID=UPI00344E27B2
MEAVCEHSRVLFVCWRSDDRGKKKTVVKERHVARSIINITSTGAVRPKDPFVPYAVAKAGLNTLTQAHAQTFGPMGVRVNAIQCGPFRTRMAAAWDEKAVAMLERTAALRRIGDPEEIGAAALYLATSDSAFVTGTILQLDGGATF